MNNHIAVAGTNIRRCFLPPLPLAIISLFFAGASLHGFGKAANTEARNAWMRGYESLETAEKAENHSEYKEALAHYQAANKVFIQVRTDYPDWNTGIIKYRIEFCTSKIDILQRLVERAQKKTKPPDLRKSVASLHRQLTKSKNRTEKFKTELNRVQKAYAKASAEAARASKQTTEFDAQAIENQKLRDKNAGLNRMIEKLSDQLARLKENAGIDDALVRLQQQTKLSKLKLKELEAERHGFNTRVTELEDQMRKLSLEREAAQQALAAERRTHEARQNHLAEIGAQLQEISGSNL